MDRRQFKYNIVLDNYRFCNFCKSDLDIEI